MGKRLQMTNQLMQALRHMHNMGVLHRDLKPQNILVSGQQTILLGDFGATIDEEREGAQTGLFSKYYADSNARNKNCTKETDIYAFGLCLFFIIHGRPMYTRDNAQAWLDNSEKN